MRSITRPRPIPTASLIAAWLCSGLHGAGCILDISMMVVSIMAYTGAPSENDRTNLNSTHITFPILGQHVQRAEIALACLGLIANPTFIFLIKTQMVKLRSRFHRLQVNYARHVVLSFPLPWHVVCFGGWVACTTLQARYAPILKPGELPECNELGSGLTQCGMVSTSWVMAIIYCCLHLILLICIMILSLGLRWQEDVVIPLYTITVDKRSGPSDVMMLDDTDPESNDGIIGGPSRIEEAFRVEKPDGNLGRTQS